MTECCCSCKHWDEASKKVPIDVRRVPKKGEFIEISSAGKLTKIQSWDWELVNLSSLDEVALLRLCFYKGIVKPWSRCSNYFPISANKEVGAILKLVASTSLSVQSIRV